MPYQCALAQSEATGSQRHSHSRHPRCILSAAAPPLQIEQTEPSALLHPTRSVHSTLPWSEGHIDHRLRLVEVHWHCGHTAPLDRMLEFPHNQGWPLRPRPSNSHTLHLQVDKSLHPIPHHHKAFYTKIVRWRWWCLSW